MNRGFGFYFGHAMRSSVTTLWHKGNLLKYFAWVIMELIASVTFVLPAMFSLANVRQAKIAQRENTVDVPQSFKVACRAKPFWTMFLAVVLEALIFIAGLMLIGVASALLGAVGYVIALFVSTVEPLIIILIFLAPGALVSLVYCIIMPILLAPTAYVIETNPEIGAADAISICFNTMKSRGKFTCFLNVFIPALVECAIIGLCAAIELVLAIFITDIRLGVVLGILVALIFFVAFVLIAPMFALARKIANQSLFEDIVLDPVNASKRTSGVNIRKCKGVKFDPAEYENELSLLFDETYGDRVPMPESPSAQRKREREERQAAKARNAVLSEPLRAVPAYVPPETASSGEEEDGELLTVSDLIRDVETADGENKEQPATPAEVPAEEPAAPEEKAEEPVKAEEPAQPEPEAKTEEPVKEEPVPEAEEPKTEEPVKEEPAPKAEEPAAPEEKEEEPAPKAAAKTTVKVTTKVAAKPAATKTTTTVKAKTAEKSAASTTAAKTTVKAKPKTTAAKKPADGDKE
ncbi:MAG: DUF975 family protein [Clostridia bacterium]|nr:DUF975 family protein [Clostridia bacterium]